jgi:hypothetical protein
MEPAGEPQIPAIDVIMSQIKQGSRNRQRLTADRARITDPVHRDSQLPLTRVIARVNRRPRTPFPGHFSHPPMIPQ